MPAYSKDRFGMPIISFSPEERLEMRQRFDARSRRRVGADPIPAAYGVRGGRAAAVSQGGAPVMQVKGGPYGFGPLKIGLFSKYNR
jgi:hypothetical protein